MDQMRQRQKRGKKEESTERRKNDKRKLLKVEKQIHQNNVACVRTKNKICRLKFLRYIKNGGIYTVFSLKSAPGAFEIEI